MTRGVIKPLDISFGEAIRRIFKPDNRQRSTTNADKKKNGTAARPPGRTRASTPAGS